jgi:hypothetical protein
MHIHMRVKPRPVRNFVSGKVQYRPVLFVDLPALL